MQRQILSHSARNLSFNRCAISVPRVGFNKASGKTDMQSSQARARSRDVDEDTKGGHSNTEEHNDNAR